MKQFYSNGYGVSIIGDGYGSDSGMFELAVLKGTSNDFRFCYDTPITDDVIGWLTWDDVAGLCAQVAALPDASEALPDYEPPKADSLAPLILPVKGDYLDGAKSV